MPVTAAVRDPVDGGSGGAGAATPLPLPPGPRHDHRSGRSGAVGVGVGAGAAGAGVAAFAGATAGRDRAPVLAPDWHAGPAAEQVLPVLPSLASLFPGGVLRRGATVTADGSTSLLLALLAGPSLAGAWCAAVGFDGLGAAAAAQTGVALDRLALVPDPGADWPVVVAALLDSLDVVVVRPPGPVRSSDARRLSARARERRAVLVPAGEWEGADMGLTLTAARWEGLGAGSGHLRGRQVEIRARGRGASARPRRARLWLPPPAGTSATGASAAPAGLSTAPAGLSTAPVGVSTGPAGLPAAVPAGTPAGVPQLPAAVGAA